jgi:hypothetical protein
MAAPLVAGTPRYLLFRSIYGEDLPPPKVVERCHILFQVPGLRHHMLPSARTYHHHHLAVSHCKAAGCKLAWRLLHVP